MKNTFAFAALVASLCVAMSSPVRAQEDVLRPSIPPRFTYGAEAGANFNMFSLDIERRTYFFEDSPYDALESGTGFSPYLHVSADYALSKRAGVMFKLGFDQKRAGNSREGLADGLIPRPGGSLIYDTTRLVFEYVNVTNFLTLGLEGRYDVTPELFFTAGPVVHIRIDSTSETQYHDYPADGPYFFDNGSRHRETENEIQSSPWTRFGIEASAGYRFPIDRSLAVVPQLRFQYMISDFIEDRKSGDANQRFYRGEGLPDETWLSNTQMHSIQLGVGVQFGL